MLLNISFIESNACFAVYTVLTSMSFVFILYEDNIFDIVLACFSNVSILVALSSKEGILVTKLFMLSNAFCDACTFPKSISLMLPPYVLRILEIAVIRCLKLFILSVSSSILGILTTKSFISLNASFEACTFPKSILRELTPYVCRILSIICIFFLRFVILSVLSSISGILTTKSFISLNASFEASMCPKSMLSEPTPYVCRISVMTRISFLNCSAVASSVNILFIVPSPDIVFATLNIELAAVALAAIFSVFIPFTALP